MGTFKVAPEIELFESADRFIEQLCPGPRDVVLTNAVIYQQHLRAYNLKSAVFFQENYGAGEPSDTMVNAILADMKDLPFDRIFAVGGGTVLDVAKILSLSGFKNVLEVLHGQVPPVKLHRLVAVPTTCGTGSEVTNIAILEETESHIKKGIAGTALFPDQAALVPDFLRDLPYRFFAFSSIDALIHALESYLAPRSNPITELFATEAVRRIVTAYLDIAGQGQTAQARQSPSVLLASTLAGIAFANTGVGAVHAMSYPLGGKYHVAHGEANYAFLGAVMERYLERNPEGKIKQLNEFVANVLRTGRAPGTMTLADLLAVIAPLKRLRDYGVKEEELPEFAEAAMAQERLLKNNYVALSYSELLQMYQSRY